MKLSFLLLFPFLFFTFIAKAQPPARILFNSSFEEPYICAGGAGNTNTCYDIISETLVPGWQVETDNVVEFWRNNFNGVTSQNGVQHIELNANNPSNVLLDVCLLKDETVTLVFHHRARGNPAATDINTMEVAAFNQVSGNIVMSNITAVNVPDGLGVGWVGSGTIGITTPNSFQAMSPTYGWTRYTCDMTNTGSSGTCRIRFRGIGGGSYGNFIDNVQIGGLNPLTEFSEIGYSDDELTGSNLPVIIINGRVDTPVFPAPPSTVQIQIANGSATNPADYNPALAALDPAIYSYDAGTGILTVTIPPGDYNGTAAQGIPIPLAIFNDNVQELNETIQLGYILGSETGNIRINDANCDNNPILNTTYIILDDDDLLPVTFTEWKLDDTECGKVKLEWKTTQELNSNYFEVQFSKEGKEWQTIAKLTAKGTSNDENKYSFVHQTDYKNGYYRLNQVDFDSKSSLTHVISSKQDCDKESKYFKFYPNPKSSNQDLTLEFYSTSTSLHYTIIDALGREIKMTTVSTPSAQFVKQNIQENLGKGLYLIKFWQDGKEVYQTKLIVQ